MFLNNDSLDRVKNKCKKSAYREHLYSIMQDWTSNILDRFLEDQRDKAIIILGDLNAQNTLWDKCFNQRHDLYVATDLDHT